MIKARALAATSLLILRFTAGCGTTTSVGEPVDAGCTETVRDGGGVVDAPEPGAPQCPSGACNYQAQTGCASGQACRPQFSATAPSVEPGCEPAGSGVSGTACSESRECTAGYFCAAGACRRQCCGGDWYPCDSGESCIRQLSVRAGGQIIDSGMELCFPVNDCDPLDTRPCPNAPDRECKIVDARGSVACEPLSTAAQGDACDSSNPCTAGLSCVLNRCRKLCRAEACGSPACDSADGTCVHFARDPLGVGECTPGW